MASVSNPNYSRLHCLPILPNELWCTIWEFLPMESVLSVSRVCQLWRSVAISCPRLWCSLTFRSSIHSTQCECRACSKTPSTGTSNLREVVALLPRSHSLPLTLQVTISVKYTDINVIESLAQSMAPHSHRIAAIQFHSAASMIPLVFFRFFDELPMLDSLVVESPQDDLDGGFPLVPGFNSTQRLRLPSLRRMAMTAGVGALPQLSESLTFLRLPYYDSAANDVLAYLQQTPNLRTLLLRFPHRNRRTSGSNVPQDLDALKAACARVPRVGVMRITERTHPHAVRLLDAPYRALTFSYARPCKYDGFCVLAAVARPALFRLTRRRPGQYADDTGEDEGERLVFALGDGARTRALELPFACHLDPALTAAWDAHPARLHAPDATVGLPLLPRVSPRVAALVSALVVEMPVYAAAAGRLLPAGVPAFPALETVEFRSEIEHPPTPYPETMIFYITQQLLRGVDRKLRTVSIYDGLLRMDADYSLLLRIADDVVRRS